MRGKLKISFRVFIWLHLKFKQLFYLLTHSKWANNFYSRISSFSYFWKKKIEYLLTKKNYRKCVDSDVYLQFHLSYRLLLKLWMKWIASQCSKLLKVSSGNTFHSVSKMALRLLMSHVLLSPIYLKNCQAGIQSLAVNSFRPFQPIKMASQYVTVEKGTPRSPAYRLFFRKSIYSNTFIIISSNVNWP